MRPDLIHGAILLSGARRRRRRRRRRREVVGIEHELRGARPVGGEVIACF
jgi:hypothetical protein